MKNKSLNLKKLIYALFILGMVSLVGCKREELGMQEASGIKRFFAENQTKSEFFVVNAGVKSSVIGKKGTIIKFEANSLLHQNGTPVTGNVTIELKEVFTKADMVKSQLQTKYKNSLLISQGQFYINAIQNGESLKIKPSKKIEVFVPNFDNAPHTSVFRGDSIPNDSTSDPIDSFINWSFEDSSWIYPSYIDSSMDSSVDSSTYVFKLEINGFGWVNLQSFFESSDLTNITMETPGLDLNDCGIFVVFDDYNALYQPFISDGFFNSYYLPIGAQVTIVALGFKDGQYYLDLREITISPYENYILDLQPRSVQEINQTLESL